MTKLRYFKRKGVENSVAADGYGDPDDDFNEPFDEPGEDDDFLWDEDLDDEPDDNTYTDQDAENHICPKCHGSGIWIDDIEPCPHCDGLGYEWWM